MDARALMGAALVLSCGLSRSAPSSTDGTDDPDGGSTERRGEVGSHVWFDTSQSIELTETWAYDSLGGDASAPSSGMNCWALDRLALSSTQLAALENLVLVPLTDGCTADGYIYHDLTVVEADGGRSLYRDTGCSYFRLEGALAMLPQGFSSALAPLGTATACPP